MNGFEKWYRKEIKPYIHNPKDRPVAEAGWKAALEWVLREGNCSGVSELDGCKLKELIEDELNPERNSNKGAWKK